MTSDLGPASPPLTLVQSGLRCARQPEAGCCTAERIEIRSGVEPRRFAAALHRTLTELATTDRHVTVHSGADPVDLSGEADPDAAAEAWMAAELAGTVDRGGEPWIAAAVLQVGPERCWFLQHRHGVPEERFGGWPLVRRSLENGARTPSAITAPRTPAALYHQRSTGRLREPGSWAAAATRPARTRPLLPRGPKVSVVVPCFNEAGGITSLHEALVRVLAVIAEDFEVVLVDDGSTDGTLRELRTLADRDPRFRYLALSRNFGKESAMLAGLSEADGDVVVLMDADLQHPPELLGQMIELLEQGYDQVVAKRTRHGDPVVRRMVSRLYYRMINKMVDVRLQDGVGDFRVMSRRAVEALLSLGEYNRFSKGLFAWIGFDTAVIDYQNAARVTGTSGWTLRKLLNYGIDGVLSFNNRPLRLAIHMGALVTLLSFGYAASQIIATLRDGVDSPGYLTLMCGIIVLGGLQLLLLGVIGEYLGRIYYESKRRPHFLVKESSPAPAKVAAATAGGAAADAAPLDALEVS